MLLVFIFLEVLKYVAYSKFNISFGVIPFTEEKSINEILPNIFLLQAWLPNANTTSWNFPAWSVSVEYYMYMIFFLTILFKNNLKHYAWLSIIVFVFYATYFNFNIKDEILNGLICFFIGTQMYAIYKKFFIKIDKLNTYIATILEFMLLVIVVFAISRNINDYYIIGTFAITVFVFSIEKGYLSNFFKYKIFSYFGKLSYSIYLTHAAILFCFSGFITLFEKFINMNLHIVEANIKMINLGFVLNNLFLFFILCVIIFVSHFSYIYIEQKGQKIGKRFLQETRRKESND